MRRLLTPLVISMLLGMGVGVAISPAGAHTSNRQEGHGDCTSDSTMGEYQWRLNGRTIDDQCNGHDGPDDWVTTNGGRDRIDGEGGGDLLDGGDEADNIFAGGNGAEKDIVQGESGGGDFCDDPGPGECERLRGEGGDDRLLDRAGLPENVDWDRTCDGPGADFADLRDGDGRDIHNCLCDAGAQEDWDLDPGTFDRVETRPCPF